MNQEQSFIKAKKPESFSAYHFAVILCLMHEPAPILLSQPTIAKRTGMSVDKVVDVLQDFRLWKWISLQSGRRQCNTNAIEIIHTNLPQPEPEVVINITDTAVRLADGFMHLWMERCHRYKNKRGWNCTRPLRRDWKRRWEPAFQRLLNSGYTYNEMAVKLNNATPNELVAGPQSRGLFPAKEIA
jgi:hypothetical protein